MRNPVAEINSLRRVEKLGEKRKFQLRDEPDDVLVDTDSMKQKGNKLPSVEQQRELQERVMEVIPERPPQCQ